MKLSEYFEKWPEGLKLACNCRGIEQKAFELRCKWVCSGSEKTAEISKFLYIFATNKIMNQGDGIDTFLESKNHELTLTEFMAIEEEPAEKDYSKDELIKRMSHEGVAPFDRRWFMEILKRIDDKHECNSERIHALSIQLSNLIISLQKQIAESEKRCREYTDQLRNDIHKQILK